jgi:hypothetical protein
VWGWYEFREFGGKKFGSPRAMLGFKGLLNALIVNEAEPDDGGLNFLEMQEALDDYVVHHDLFAQTVAASWLVKYKFVDTMPQSIHSADLVRGRHTSGSLPPEDIANKFPPRFMIGTLLIAGNLLETSFNQKNIDLEVADTSLGAAYRKLFYLWETHTHFAIGCSGYERSLRSERIPRTYTVFAGI